MALDKELVNFGEEHELNAILSKFGKSQSQKNRATLGELGKKCKEKLAKRVLTQDEFGEFVKAHLKELEDKKAYISGGDPRKSYLQSSFVKFITVKFLPFS